MNNPLLWYKNTLVYSCLSLIPTGFVPFAAKSKIADACSHAGLPEPVIEENTGGVAVELLRTIESYIARLKKAGFIIRRGPKLGGYWEVKE